MYEEKETQKLNRKLKKINRKRSINKDILKITVAIAILFLAMAVYLGYFMEFRAQTVINNNYNKRFASMKEKVVRGSIYAEDGVTVLAETTVDAEGNEHRTYPFGSLFAHVVGFEDQGGLGLESSYSSFLLSSNISILKKLENEMKKEKSPGNSLITTLNPDLQRVVNDVMSQAGDSAAIAMDPDSGRILSVVSKPDFDPGSINEIWDSITADENNSILVNRATQGLYAPGSTFKIFTLNEYLYEHPLDYDKYDYICTGEYTVDDMTMHCYNYTAHGELDLEKSLAYSCNCSFAEIGAALNLQKLKDNNEKMYFGRDLPLDLPHARSSFSLSANAPEPEVIQTAIGQGNTLVTPAHLAIVMSAIAHDGTLVKPHLVQKVINENGSTVRSFEPGSTEPLLEEKTAKILKEYLRDVVVSGTANNLSYGNYTAYGKTGTAETVSNFNVDVEAADHSWFVGWAENDNKRLVVCVLIEKAQNTWGSAAQFAQQIFDYYFQS